jgi:hypothetical protein
MNEITLRQIAAAKPMVNNERDMKLMGCRSVDEP